MHISHSVPSFSESTKGVSPTDYPSFGNVVCATVGDAPHQFMGNIESLEGEIWKDIIGFEGRYMVSSFSRILSCERSYKVKGRLVTVPQMILKNSLAKHGYYTVGLRQRLFYVHRLVAAAFIPNPENKNTVNHINSVRTDNRIENLEWCTQGENIRHAFTVGNGKKGEEHHLSTLTNETVREIRRVRKETGLGHRRMHRLYFPNVSAAIIKSIYSDKNWKSVA